MRAATGNQLWCLFETKTKESDIRLARVYDRFTEGLETADLKEARAPLDELNERIDYRRRRPSWVYRRISEGNTVVVVLWPGVAARNSE